MPKVIDYFNVQNFRVKKKVSPCAICIYLLLALCIPSQNITAQRFNDIHGFIKKLSSDSLYGRGYQHDGDIRAAQLISEKFLGLGYHLKQQTVRFHLNEFPVTPKLSINGKLLVVGKDFLPDPSSPTATITFDRTSGLGTYKTDLSDIYLPNSESPDIILTRKESLIHSLSGKQSQIPQIHLNYESWPDSITSFKYSIESVFREINSNNLIFFADSTRPFTHLILAHYDHLGVVGDVIFNGANDNASGMGMMLFLADTLRAYSDEINPLFVAFTAEEAGLIGSRYFHHYYKTWWENASVVLNFDMMASGDGQIGLVGAIESEELFERIERIEKPEHFYFKPRPNSPISDHFWFIESGLKGFYVYTGNGSQPYHHPKDDFESLNLTLFDQMAEFLARFVSESANN